MNTTMDDGAGSGHARPRRSAAGQHPVGNGLVGSRSADGRVAEDHAEGVDLTVGEKVEEVDAVVVGGGMAGLTAAWELTRAGLRPLVVEARGYWGGLVAGGPVGGIEMDLGAEAFVLRGEAVTSMVSELGLDVSAPEGGGARLFLPPLDEVDTPPQVGAGPTLVPSGGPASPGSTEAGEGWALHAFPAESFLGIPVHPLAEDVVSVIGPAAAQRAARDTELGGTVGVSDGTPSDLASFVTARMGPGVVDRLVRPIVAGIHAADPSVLDADTVAPGLREATARLGSLSAAMAERRARRAVSGRPRPVDVTATGGLFHLPRELAAAIEAAGGQVLTRIGAQVIQPVALAARTGNAGTAGRAAGVPAAETEDGQVVGPTTDAALPTPAQRTGQAGSADAGADPRLAPSGLWEVDLTPTIRGATPSAEPVTAGPVRRVRTRRLVLACSAQAALRLLRGAPGVDTAVEMPAGAPIARFTLVVRAPDLDDGPVGSGLLVAPPQGRPCPVQAKALSHLSVKWPWVGEAAVAHGAGTHVLRLSYGRPDEPYPQVDLARALADVAALTGVKVAVGDVLDSRLVRWDGTLPPVTPAYRARTQQLLDQAHALPGLAVCGAWVAGTGIAAVVDQAREQAGRLARHPG